MALTAISTFDILGMTQTITFNNPGQVDQVIFSSNSITLKANSSFTLNKTDLALYFQYLNAYSLLLSVNFPSVNKYSGAIWPLCVFKIDITNPGVQQLEYKQTSGVNVVQDITYHINTHIGTFTGRASDVTISLAEFFQTILMSNQYAGQIALN